MRSGFVSIIGRPNVGKSTLLNNIIGEKISIVSDKVQTTRNNIQGIYNEKETQIIFIDTPGIHKPKDKLGKYLNRSATNAYKDVDVVLFLVDAVSGLGKGDKLIINYLNDIEKPVFLIINKIDKLNKEQVFKSIEEYKDLYKFAEIIPVSALKGDNTDKIIRLIKNYLSDNVKYYHDDEKTNMSDSFIISEIIREKVLELTHDEIPHSVTCFVEKLENKKEILKIGALIIVDRPNLKKIIIGNGGSKIKEIGVNARKDLEDKFKKKIYLELFVQVKRSWRNKDRLLEELGYKNME